MTPPVPPERPALADLQDHAWQGSRYRSLALVVLAASIASGPLVLWQALSGRSSAYVLALAAAAAALGTATTERLGRPSWRQHRGLAYRLGEAVGLLLLARIATWALDGGWPTPTDLGAWLRAPLSFLDGPFLFTTVTLLIVWVTAINSASDFLDLALQPDEIAAQQPLGYGESLSDRRAVRPLARSDILGRFARRWLWGGVTLIVMAGLVRLDVQVSSVGLFRVGLRNLGLPPVVLGGLLAYFLSGLLLISEARLAVLRAQWFTQQITVTPPVLKRWRINSALLVGLGALLALTLPLGSLGGLTKALLWFLGLLAWIGMLLYYLLNRLLMLLLAPLSRLIGQDTAPGLPPEPPALVMPTQAEAASHLPDWLGGVLVWSLVALVAGYLLWNFLQANGLLTGWPALLARWRGYWRSRHWRFGAAVRGGLARLRLPSTRPSTLRLPGNVLRIRALSPQERVRYFYLLAVRRAAERGLVRPPHKTPQEFLDDLASAWPEAEADTQALTEAFIAARYANQPVEAGQLHTAHDIWRRVMRALRRHAGAERS